MTIYEKLVAIQNELKVPKSEHNDFGDFYYRSFEGICEAVKPLLKKYKAALILTDEIKAIEGRIYVYATAHLIDTESDKEISVSACAGEPPEKKKMDASQLTGAASSYARKYACNGLFLLDDNKDPDTNEHHKQTNPEKAKPAPPAKPEETRAKPAMIMELFAAAEGKHIPREKLLAAAHVKNPEELTEAQVKGLMNRVNASSGKEQ